MPQIPAIPQPHRPQPLALSELGEPSKGTAPLSLSMGPGNPILQVKATLTVNLGSIEVSVGELMAAREHQVLKLDRSIDQPVDVMLEGQVVARGMLVAVGDAFGVRLTELPLALKS